MFSFLALLLACCVGAAWSVVPPRLSVGAEVVVRLADEDIFQLRCEGSQKVTWNTSVPPDILVIETEKQENSEYPFVSTLTIREPHPEDTGFYRCHYDGAANLKTDKDNVASTYVYVYDGNSIFVNSDYSSVVVRTRDKLTLDCRTTLPDATLTLAQNGMDVTIDAHTRWDPKIGFVVLSVTVQDAGFYVCQSASTGETQPIHVVVKSASVTLQPPSIDQGPNPHFVVGLPFILNCTLVRESEATLTWSYPNTGANYQSETSNGGEGDNKYVFSTLTVPKASKRDSGKYTCTATAQSYDTSSDSLDIEVQDELKAYVRVKSSDKISVNQGDKLKWKAEVFSFPHNPRIVYTDWRGDVITDTDDRISMDFKPDTASSWLRITNITANDFGRYTLSASTRDGAATGNATVSIEVESAPVVEVKGMPDYLRPWSKLYITCSAQGFPVPSITWEFQSCPSGPSTCSTFEDIEGGETPLLYPDPGNLVLSTATLTPKSSGFLRCSANNSLDTANTTVPVSLSDIDGLHVLRHRGLNTTTELAVSSALTVITNDDFMLKCGANRLRYRTVMLHTPPRYEGEVVEGDTELSWVKKAVVGRVTKALQGSYSCIAQRHDNTTQIKSVTVNVLEETAVKFLEDANMAQNKTVEVTESAPFFLNCTVGGRPKPSVTWKIDGKPLTRDSPFFDGETALFLDDLQRLELKFVFKENVGVYTCLAENRVNRVAGRLKLIVPAAGLSTPAKVGLGVAVVGIVILIIAVTFLMKRVKTERKFRKSFRANELYLFQKGNIGQLNPDCSADEQAELLPYGQEWEVSREQISLGKQLGSGAFGRVVEASVTGIEGPAATTVAIKMCKSQADPSQIRALALELKIMIHLGKHLNIVNLMGANTGHIGRGELWILVEYCRFGNLLVFMHRHRKSFINQIDPITGRIDPTKVTPDHAGTLRSPISPSAGSWRHMSSTGSHDGFSATPNTPFPLSPPPLGHPAATPQPQTSGTPQVHNPIYNPPMLSPGGGGGVIVPPTPSAATSECCGSARTTLDTTSSSTASDGRQQNTYYTSSLGSNVSHAPMSPAETGYLDSHGNPFVHEVGSVPGVNTPFTTSDLMCWAWQVAHGMDYLASRKVLHGDLAARNLLLGDDNVVKISDFGLSREMYKKDVYMKKSDDLMPIKWISVEAIRDRIFSVQSDVWAFGVTLWEIFSLGSNPYPGIEVNPEFVQLLDDGYRMACPKYANPDIYNLLLECWEAEPSDRPSFRQALHRLDAMMQPDVTGEYLSMNDQYMRMNEERFKEQPDYLNMLTPPEYENMTNRPNDDDLDPHYLNMEVAGGATLDTTGQQATILSPGVVSYSNARTSSPSPTSPTSPTNHYLPMDCKQRSATPENYVFSPSPSEDTRFTFPHHEDNTSPAAAGVPSKEDKPYLESVKVNGKLSDTEHSTLITNGRRDT